MTTPEVLPVCANIRFVSDDGTIDRPMQVVGVQHLDNGLIEYMTVDPAWKRIVELSNAMPGPDETLEVLR